MVTVVCALKQTFNNTFDRDSPFYVDLAVLEVRGGVLQ